MPQNNNKIHFLSTRQDWRTPKAFYETLDAEFHFDHDPCPVNPTQDGLFSPWGLRNFVNPPYGRELAKWVKRAYGIAQGGALVVLLIPARPDTSYWHDYILKAHQEGWAEIRFIRGRLHFDDGKKSAPFPSAVIVMKKSGAFNDSG